jgi:UDP-2,4-diacetamido-2,4,6-trideoxy-beta-L-altropyranose hydrolase
MKVFIITEGSKNTGFGHVTRCLSLYQDFEERGILPEFIINGDSNVEYLLKDANYQIFNWLDEKSKLFEKVKDADIAIIDSYLADISVYNVLSDLVKLSVYVDDNKRLNYPKGIVLNANIHAEKLNYPKKDGVTYLLGTRYTPLRKEFWEVPQKKIKEKVESIMITFGGDDAKNMTPKILAFLNDEYSNLIKNVIIGRSFQNIDEIKEYMDKNTNLIYYPDAEKMKEIMLESDIAVSASGQTLNELASVGVPTIGVCVAENQMGNIKGWRSSGFLEYTGWYNNSNILEKIKNSIKHLEGAKIRNNKTQITKKIIDGKGSSRIIRLSLFNLFKKNLILRKVNFEDALEIFNLSNDDVVRKNSFTPQKIEWGSHLIWLKNKLEDENSIYFAVINDLNKFYGLVRFDIDPISKVAIIGISLKKNIRGMGLSPVIIDKAVNELLKIKSIKLIKAYIKNENIPSIKSFEKAKFVLLDNLIIKGSKSKLYIKEV